MCKLHDTYYTYVDVSPHPALVMRSSDGNALYIIALLRGNHWWLVDFPHKGQLMLNFLSVFVSLNDLSFETYNAHAMSLLCCILTGHEVAIELDVAGFLLGRLKVQGGVMYAIRTVVIVHIAGE